MDPLALLAVPAFAFLAAVVVKGFLSFATARGVMDVPNERSSHTKPTPRGGGIGIVIAVTCGWGIFALLGTEQDRMAPILAGSLLVAGIGFLDDVKPQSNRLRFGVQLAAVALGLSSIGMRTPIELPLVGVLPGGPIWLPIFALWAVGLTNAYNFMDGIDGMAGLQAVVAGAAWLVLGTLVEAPTLTRMGALIAGGSLGFLVFNWPPARIFMGDVGSTFLGYLLALTSLYALTHGERLAWAGLIIVWPFVFDTTFTVLCRLLRRENIFAAHRTHLYQRLVRAGLRHWHVSVLYATLSLIGVLVTLGWVRYGQPFDVLMTGVISSLCLALWILVVRRERKQLAR